MRTGISEITLQRLIDPIEILFSGMNMIAGTIIQFSIANHFVLSVMLWLNYRQCGLCPAGIQAPHSCSLSPPLTRSGRQLEYSCTTHCQDGTRCRKDLDAVQALFSNNKNISILSIPFSVQIQTTSSCCEENQLYPSQSQHNMIQ